LNVRTENTTVGRLQLVNFRTFTEAQIEPTPGLNVLVGPNGVGKTNLLEAIHVGLIARSQRGSPDGAMIANGESYWRVGLSVLNGPVNHDVSIGFEQSSSRKITLDGSSVRPREYIGRFPVISIGPEDIGLASAGPAVRRRYLDLHMSQVDAVYLSDLLAYRRALAQRNRALKDIASGRESGNDPSHWDDALSSIGGRIVSHRDRFVQRISESAAEQYRTMSGSDETLTVRYVPNIPNIEGLDTTEALLSALRHKRQQDIALGSTTIGPHRDDLSVEVTGRDARAYASQGQRRCASLALLIAAQHQLRKARQVQPVLLLDDVFAELDPVRSDRLAELLMQGGQVFVATPRDADVRKNWDAGIFRVSPGRVDGI
jgi:DNA replication and repair protein RecF